MTPEEKDWTEPIDGVLHIPDRLDDLFNRLGTQLRLHTVSGELEPLVVARMTMIADKHANSQCAPLREEIERLKTQLKNAFEAGRNYERGECSEFHGGVEHDYPDFDEWKKKALEPPKQ